MTKSTIPKLSVSVPKAGATRPSSKSPQSPHIFAQVKKFYDIQIIYAIVTSAVVSLFLCLLYPFVGILVCDSVRQEATVAMAIYLAISFTAFAPPLPFHVLRSYVIPMYITFLFVYQHPNGGSLEKGLADLKQAYNAPLELGWTTDAARFAFFVWMAFFTVLRFLGFVFMKSHTLAPGEKPRIMLCSDGAYPSIHGVATFNTNITKRLMKDNYPVHVVTGSPAFEAKDQHQIAGAPCTRIPCIFTTVGPQTPLGIPYPWLLTRIFLGFRPHMVHILEPGSAMNVVISFFCWLFGIPTMISHHTHTMEYRFAMSKTSPTFSKYMLFLNYRTVIALASLHVTTTKILMDPRIHGVIAWSWLHVRTPNGIPPMFWPTGSNEEFDISHRDEDMRYELSNGNPDAHLIVHVGRFVKEKNIMDYVPVIIKLCDKHGDKVQFALVGWGPLLKPFMQAVIDAGHGDRIKAMNTLTGKRLYQAYASSDIFFSPSGSETYPIVYLEAMRSGCVPVAPNGPNAGGSQHTFTPGKHGFQYPRGDVDAAVVAVEKAMDAGTSLQGACLAHGRLHTWDHTMDCCLKFYDVVLRAFDVLQDGEEDGQDPNDVQIAKAGRITAENLK